MTEHRQRKDKDRSNKFMAIYAIADLHLGFDKRVEKPMDIYGERWINHTERIKEDWKSA